MSSLGSIVVVGASTAGLRAAEVLREEGFDGALTLVGDEDAKPYDRPPLSKQVLAGSRGADDIRFPAADADLGIDWRLGTTAESLDLARRVVHLAGGETVGFDGLVIATGCRPRTIDAGGLAGVHTLRTLDDSLAIRAEVEKGTRVVVVGAGFIGAEVAATCREQGAEVTMVEALPQPLARVLGEEMGAVCGELHRDHGVDVRTGVGVDGFEGDQRVERVRLSDGTTVDADVVVVGIGVVPNTEWLEGSGVRLDNGVVCDDTTLVAPGVVAAGDVARWPNLAFDEMMRVEHWENALEMGAHAARRLLAGDDAARIEVYRPIPWFWSDQYDRKIQMCGWPRGTDDVHVVAGSVEERRFTALYGRGGRVTAAFGMNMPARIVRYRFAIADGLDWADALAAG